MKNFSSRRAFLLSTTAAVPLALGACGSVDMKIASVAKDAKLIASGFAGVLQQLGRLNLPGLTPALVAYIGVAVAGITSLADALGTAATAAEAQPLVEKIAGYTNAVVGALATLPLPPAISMALQAAMVLLPLIELAVGLVASPAHPARSALAAPAAPLTSDQAREFLALSAPK